MAQTVKSLPAVWETRVQSLGREDPLEKEMATHSSILAMYSTAEGVEHAYRPNEAALFVISWLPEIVVSDKLATGVLSYHIMM